MNLNRQISEWATEQLPQHAPERHLLRIRCARFLRLEHSPCQGSSEPGMRSPGLMQTSVCSQEELRVLQRYLHVNNREIVAATARRLTAPKNPVRLSGEDPLRSLATTTGEHTLAEFDILGDRDAPVHEAVVKHRKTGVEFCFS